MWYMQEPVNMRGTLVSLCKTPSLSLFLLVGALLRRRLPNASLPGRPILLFSSSTVTEG